MKRKIAMFMVIFAIVGVCEGMDRREIGEPTVIIERKGFEKIVVNGWRVVEKIYSLWCLPKCKTYNINDNLNIQRRGRGLSGFGK